MLIDVGLPAICVILPPAPSLLQEDSSDACVSIDALASAAERLRSHGQAGSNPKVRLADDPPRIVASVVSDQTAKISLIRLYQEGDKTRGHERRCPDQIEVEPRLT